MTNRKEGGYEESCLEQVGAQAPKKKEPGQNKTTGNLP